MPELTIRVEITAGQYLAYYRGRAKAAQGLATTGQVVQFPAAALQRHVAKDGIHGLFRIVFDENNKFVALNRVNDEPPSAALL